MKKVITGILAALLALSAGAFFAACGDGEQNEGDGNTDPTIYTVTAEESDFYDVGWHTTQATAGTAASVEIVPEYDFVTVEKVFYNGQECTKGEGNEYTYTMPAENVEIAVELSFADKDSSEYDRVSWNEDNNYTIEAGEGKTATLVADINISWMTSADFVVLSSNEKVIPQTAFPEELDTILDSDIHGSSGSSEIIGVKIDIDCTDISSGQTQIVLVVKKSFTESYAICKTVTVTEAAA